jgi:dTDP-4-dehydrorhamnose 3,5-epimerase
MDFCKTEISGLYLVKPKELNDERGWFMRTFSENLFKDNIPNFNSIWFQMNHSFTKKKHTWRGLHYQKFPSEEVKLVRCISGKVLDFVIDIRSNSPTFLKSFCIELSQINKQMLFIPRGLAHGFLTLEDNSELIYLHDKNYDPKNERGLRYDDPLINLKLPFLPKNISKRDSEHKLLNKNFKGL